MKDKTVAILESRIGEHMAELVRRHGGTPVCAPALAELPDVDPAHIEELLADWQRSPPDMFIFQTGVGVKALFATTDALGLTDRLLTAVDRAQVVVRGPKPTAVLRSRGVRIDMAAKDPYTTAEVLAELEGKDLTGRRIAVQRYGETNRELHEALEKRGASVTEIATYRWGLPQDTAPLAALVGALERNEIDAVAFTSASQVHNLFTVAGPSRQEALKAALGRTLVASIGPVCATALAQHDVRVDVEAHPPKLGPFIQALDEACRQDER